MTTTPHRSQSHYTALSLAPSASQSEIRARYLKLVRLYHPDKNRHTIAARIHEINEAYSILSDVNKRRHYDSILRDHPPTPTINTKRISARVDLDSFTADELDDQVKFTLGCRCGSEFLITSNDLLQDDQNEEMLIECNGCSEIVAVVYS